MWIRDRDNNLKKININNFSSEKQFYAELIKMKFNIEFAKNNDYNVELLNSIKNIEKTIK